MEVFGYIPTFVSPRVHVIFRHVAPVKPGIIDKLPDVGRKSGIACDCGEDVHDVLARSKVHAIEKAIGTCFSPATTCETCIFQGGYIKASEYFDQEFVRQFPERKSPGRLH